MIRIVETLLLTITFVTNLNVSLWRLEALADTPSDPYQQGLDAVQRSDWTSASKALQQAVASGGCPAMAYYLLGFADAKLGALGDAIVYENKALDCTPPLVEPFLSDSKLLLQSVIRYLGAQPRLGFHFVMSTNLTKQDAKEREEFENRIKELIHMTERHVPDSKMQFIIGQTQNPCVSGATPEQAKRCTDVISGVVAPPGSDEIQKLTVHVPPP